jgi:hypothetical protein
VTRNGSENGSENGTEKATKCFKQSPGANPTTFEFFECTTPASERFFFGEK